MKSTQIFGNGLSIQAVLLACWAGMFLAGNDAWHDTGRPAIWHLEGPPYADLRAFLIFYYVAGAILLAGLIARTARALTGWRRQRARAHSIYLSR
jgi:hypothetical protein